MSADIQDILDGNVTPQPAQPEVEPQAEPEPTPEPEAEAKPTEDTGAQPDKAEPKADSSPESQSTVPISALHGERDRRQAAEQRAASLEAQLSEQEKPQPTSVFEDEGEFRKEIDEKVEVMLANQRYMTSEWHARREFGNKKVDLVMERFAQLAEESPEYTRRVRESQSPYHEAIDIVEKADRADRLDDVEKREADIQKRIDEGVAKALAERDKADKSKAAEADKLRDSIPESLASQPSHGGLKGSDWSGPTPLKNIID